eukprot:6174430-Pleurochrysis_carterae.AAC.1
MQSSVAQVASNTIAAGPFVNVKPLELSQLSELQRTAAWGAKGMFSGRANMLSAGLRPPALLNSMDTGLATLAAEESNLAALAAEETGLAALAAKESSLATLAGWEAGLASTLAGWEPGLATLGAEESSLAALAAEETGLVTLAAEESGLATLAGWATGLAAINSSRLVVFGSGGGRDVGVGDISVVLARIIRARSNSHARTRLWQASRFQALGGAGSHPSPTLILRRVFDNGMQNASSTHWASCGEKDIAPTTRIMY